MSVPIARIVQQRSHLLPGKIRVTEHFFEVPYDYASPASGTIRLFARSARRHNAPVAPDDPEEEKKKEQLPWLVYLQGGPGFECRNPASVGWTNNFIDKGYQVLLLDQRGTGLSSPIDAELLKSKGDGAAQAKYLKAFRADSIVKDCEATRKALTADYPETKKKWSVLGQSFGGFCCTTYLSLFPKALREVFMTGGLPPLVDQPDEVYRRLFKKVVQRNQAYYKKYPEDVERVKSIVRWLTKQGGSVKFRSGGLFTARRFLQIGLFFGYHNGFDTVHDLVLRVWSELENYGRLTLQTLDQVDQIMSFDSNILYAILHEPLYCQGKAAGWSAQRILTQKFPGFDPEKTIDLPEQPVYFTGEMIFPWMFEDYSGLQPLQEAANILAKDSSWPMLYDLQQLANNEVPVYAAVFLDDMFVDFVYSMETANAIKGCKTFATNVMYHNAIGAKMEEVVEGLWKLRCDTID